MPWAAVARRGIGGEEGFEAKRWHRKLWSDRTDLWSPMPDPSSVARVSGEGAVAASHLCAWWWGFRWRPGGIRHCRVVVEEVFFFRLGKASDFRFCFYHLMIEADAYSYWVLVGCFFFFFFENTFGLGLLGICLGLMLGFFLGFLCYNIFFFSNSLLQFFLKKF